MNKDSFSKLDLCFLFNPNPICSQHFTLILDYHSVFSNLVKGCWRELFLKINPIITEDKLINGREFNIEIESHKTGWMLNTDLINMKCTVKGN
jgi:hypothetical protein